MRHQLRYLRAPLPVVLDPVLRFTGEPVVGEVWTLPIGAESRVLMTFGGTAALFQAALSLRLSPSDTVLLPSYNCGHEVEPFLRAGLKVDFYRVDDRFGVDIEHLGQKIDRNTRAVLVTHYFGFPQPVAAIRTLCDRHGIALIEDCAHALFSNDAEEPLGRAGHFAVYSLRKTLALPHGGALVCHDPRWSLPQQLLRPPLLSTAPKVLERYQKGWLVPQGRSPGTADRAAFVGTRLLVDVARGLRQLGNAAGLTQLDPDDESLAFPGQALRWGVARAVERDVFHTPHNAIVAARRRNYELLLAHAARFKDCEPALPRLPVGVCPLYFPVFAAQPEECVDRCQQRAIAAIEWWTTLHPAVPWAQFPEALRLKQSLVALPVHQDLTPAHMQRIVEALTAD